MRYVAFLRAVNVGGRTVKMNALRDSFERVGLKRVETFIASGNVLFESSAKPPALERRIEEMIETDFGFASATFVRTVDELRSVADFDAFPDTRDIPRTHALHVGFLKTPLERAGLEALANLSDATNSLRAIAREVHWYSRDRMSVLKLMGSAIEKRIGASATFRNMNTIRRLAAKL